MLNQKLPVNSSKDSTLGLIYGIFAYAIWGLFPIYWKHLKHVPSSQILGHRILWSFVFLFLFFFIRKELKPLLKSVTKQNILFYFMASIVIGFNWLIYIWAINANFVVETSLGYFISPIFSMLFGMFLFKENVSLKQILALAFSSLGVLILVGSYGRIPWIALALAISFSTYGMIKKKAPLTPLLGLLIESLSLLIPTLGYFAYLHQYNSPIAPLNLLLVCAGIVSIIPLFCYSSCVKLIPMTTVGMLQYISPTLQFILGVFVYKENFSAAHLMGFCFIWFALALMCYKK